MRFNFLTCFGVGFYLLVIFGALRLRHDLTTMQTEWGRTLFRRPTTPISRAESPLRYWLAIAANIFVLFVFGVIGGLIMRAGAGRFTRL